MIPSNFITQQNTTKQGYSCFYYRFYVPFYFDDTKIYPRTTQKQVIWSSEAEMILTLPYSQIHDMIETSRFLELLPESWNMQ